MSTSKSMSVDIISADLQLKPLVLMRLGYKFCTRFFILCLLCLSQSLFALGLGEIKINSVINEPLSATIEVLNADGIDNNELLVNIASAVDYQVAGVSWDFSHTELAFDVGYAVNGDLIVNVSSERAIREPYLSILVQAHWPAGRLLREYTILLDFPIFSGEQEVSVNTPSEAIPATDTNVQEAQPVQRDVAPASRASDQTNLIPRTASRASDTPTQPLTDDEYRIANGDTLWSLGGRVAQDLGVTRHQAILAIYEANPEAFSQSNLNILRSGSLIRVPTRTETLGRTAEEASNEYAQAMRSNGQFIADATPLQSRATDFREEIASENEPNGQFRLASTEQQGSGVGGSGLSLSETEVENQRLSDINSALQEELEAVEIENEDLSERLRNLEEQISVMEALIEVENNDIRAIQEAATSPELQPEPIINSIDSANIQEESFISKLMGWLPIVGLILIGLLIGIYLAIRRRRSSDEFSDISAFDEEYDANVPIYAEDEPNADQEFEESVPLEEDLENFVPERVNSIDELSEDEDKNLEASDVEEDNEQDWNSDFDDLDSFFDEVDNATLDSEPEEEQEDGQLVLDEDNTESMQVLGDLGISEIAPENDLTEETSFDMEAEVESEIADDNLMEFESAETNENESIDEIEPVDIKEENTLDFSLDEEELFVEENTENTSFDSAETEQDEEFSLDFDLDSDDVESEESVDAEITENIPASEDEAEDEDEDEVEFELDELSLSNVDEENASLDEEDEVLSVETNNESEDLDLLLDDLGPELDDLSIFDSEDVSDTQDDESFFDADLNEDLDLDSDENDASLLLDEGLDSPNNGPAEQEDSADEDLLTDFDEDELDISDLNSSDDADGLSPDMLEECETKMELAIAYMEMGDSSGAKELLEEVVREGDDSYKEKANTLLEGLD